MATTVKSKPQTGLAIKRNANKFVLSWKFGDKDYNDGQTCRFRCNSDKFGDLSVGKKTTQKTGVVDPSKYYPSRAKYLKRVQFALRGNRSKYTEKKKTIDPAVSDWVYAEFAIKAPGKPTLTATLSEDYSNVCTFNWSETVDTASHIMFTDCEWQSMLVKNCDVTDGSKLKWRTSALGWIAGTSGATGYRQITERTDLLAAASHTRWFRVRARGAAGASDWRYAKHVYARPNQVTIKNASVKQTTAGGYLCTVEWTLASPASHPADIVTVQYCFAVPDLNMGCPEGVSWSEAGIIKDTAYTDKLAFSIDSVVGTDQCLFVRVNTEHDTNITYGQARAAAVGKLADPTDLIVSNLDDTNFRATITCTNASSVADSFLEVRFVTGTNADGICVGIIPRGQTQTTVQCPDWSSETTYGFKVRAVVGSYAAVTGDAAYTVTARMHSAHWLSYGGSVPQAPANVSLTMTDIPGTVQVTFDWTWSDADAAELSWADHADAWESTDEPETYIIANTHAPRWNISGLETGVTWYIRVRLLNGTDDPTYGVYSEIASIDLSSAPVTPVLELSTNVVTEDGTLTASWVYVSTDGTQQGHAEICEYVNTYQLTEDQEVDASKTYYVLDENTENHYPEYVPVAAPDVADIGSYYEFAETYTGIIARANSEQHVTINTEGWQTGEEHLLAVRVVSESGRETEWSEVASVVVAEAPLCVIAQTSLIDKIIITEDDAYSTKALTAMPLTLTVTGAGTGGTTYVTVARAEAYHVERPDESTFNGYEGETAAIVSQTGEGQITIEDVSGHLDDGALYTIIATVRDSLGQTAETTMDFMVIWDHQAEIPGGTVEIDPDNIAARLKPIAPEGAAEGDACDIYRLSADKPQLIYKGAVFGEEYVDPYPTIGEFGGYRFVTVTADGDYITADNTMAWLDVEAGVESNYNVIDFDGGRVLLIYNIDVSNKWAKEFKQTVYLGGAVQGDWNPAVIRSGSVSAVSIAIDDRETIEAMRRLAEYSGICHVRTKEGSSYAADVQVSESYSVSEGHRLAHFNLSINKVESDHYDGMTLAEWETTHQED